MKEYKSVLVAAIIGVSAIICVFLGMNGWSAAIHTPIRSSVSITGVANMEVDADRAVLRGTISGYYETEEEADAEAKTAKQYFTDQGITIDELYLEAPDISSDYDYYYGYEETTAEEEESQSGYDFSQKFCISSNDIDKIDKIAALDGSIPGSKLEWAAGQTEYYCKNTDELKLKLMELATQDAKAQLDIILKDSGNTVGPLSTVNVGTMQIAGNKEPDAASLYNDYLYEDTYSPELLKIYSKKKPASIRVNFRYIIEE